MTVTDAIESEYEALTTRAAHVRRDGVGVLALTGDDGAEFLQGQVTNDVESLAEGEGCYAALLTPKGKIRADMRVLRAGDDLLVICEPAALRAVKHTVETYRIGFRFGLEDRSDDSALVSVVGPGAAEALAAIGAAAPGTGSPEHATSACEAAGRPALAIATDVGVDLLVPKDAADEIAEALTASGTAAASVAAAEIVRVEHGRPRLGFELDADTIPQEADLNERAVNFEKGCYVGQETVARLFYKGKPNRRLRGLKLDAPVASGVPVVAANGRELGRVGTAVVSPAGGPIALAVLRHEASEGDAVSAGAVRALVVPPENLAPDSE